MNLILNCLISLWQVKMKICLKMRKIIRLIELQGKLILIGKKKCWRSKMKRKRNKNRSDK